MITPDHLAAELLQAGEFEVLPFLKAQLFQWHRQRTSEHMGDAGATGIAEPGLQWS